MTATLFPNFSLETRWFISFYFVDLCPRPPSRGGRGLEFGLKEHTPLLLKVVGSGQA